MTRFAQRWKLESGFGRALSQALFIRLETVRARIRSVYDKRPVTSETEAVLKAIREGLG